MVDAYYDNLLGRAPARPYSLDMSLLQLPSRDMSNLDIQFTEEEVEKVIKSMPFGPDGFTGRFFASCWTIIKGDIMRAFHAFHQGDMRGLPAINKAIVTLLPEMDGAEDIKDFRSVSLVHGAIKLFDKVLANRLTMELLYLVGNHQSAFVRGRSIHDNFMLVQCTARKLKALKEPTVMMKLDITKAFDSVQWPFLMEVLRALGFSDKWREWICGLLATSSTRIMVNGIPGKPILNCIGLRQGDPISPLLFILIMEPLHKMFELAASRGILTPLAGTGISQRLSMFADGVMIFLKPWDNDLHACAALLRLFGDTSGLRVNLTKSAAFPIRCSPDIMQRVVEILDCPLGAFPCKYLGLPLTLRKQTAAQLRGLVDQLAGYLPRWKAVNMPKSGRMLLIQSVLCAIPIHAMMALDIPVKTITDMEKICRGFLWCAQAQANGGQCIVAWDKVCSPKWAGGLGIPNLRWLNLAMQARWPWLQRVDGSRPWAEFDITVPKESRQLIQAATRTLIGNGSSTRFWEDRWIQGARVEDIAPNLYAKVPQSTRSTRTVSQGLQNGAWAADVGPELNEVILQEYMTLWELLAEVQLHPEAVDVTTWSWEANGCFSTRSAYVARFWGKEVVPTATFTWKSKAPLRCPFFAWTALQNRCWTSDRLARHGLDHQEACPFCDQEEESINHLLIGCVFAREIWTGICLAMNRPDWIPSTDTALEEWCTNKVDTTVGARDIRALLLLGMWELWKHRNAIVFDGATPSLSHVISRIVLEGRTWKRASLFKGDVEPIFRAVERWASERS